MSPTQTANGLASHALPSDWTWQTIASLASPVRNAIVGGPFGSELVSKDYVADGVPVIRGQNMGPLELVGPYAFVTEEKADSLKANLARPGDIVFTQRGTLGQVSVVPPHPYGRYLISQSQMKVAVDSTLVESTYLHAWFSSEFGQSSISQSAIQTGVPHINLGILRSLLLALPPLSEQKKIADALRDADSALAKLDALVAKKRDLKQAAMQQLLTGQTRLPGYDGGWTVSTVGAEFEIELGKMLDAARNSGVHKPYIGNKAVQWGRIEISELETVPMSSADLGRYRLSKGDLLVCEGGEVGRAAIWDAPLAECYYQKALHRLRPLRGFNCQLMAGFLRLWAERGALTNFVTQTSIAHLPREKFMQIPLPVPPIPEQNAIAAVLSDMDAELSGLEVRRDKTRALKQGMMQELLTGRIRLI